MKLLPLLFLAACAVDEAPVSEAEQAVKSQPGDCPSYGCGTNSPALEGRYFSVVNEVGQATPEGFRLISFGRYITTTTNTLVWQELRADVLNGQLLARDRRIGSIVLQGEQLIGTKFTFEDAVGARYYVTVARALTTVMWASNQNVTPQTWQYELRYTTDAQLDPRNVCTKPPTADRMDPQMSVLFDDDHIDTDALAVDREDANSFTIGCAGSALAKMHLSGHTKAGSKLLNRPTTLDQRTAFLKMLAADYCGMGHAYTVAGMPLHYRDVGGFMNTVLPNEPIEGLWTKNGALCVGKPRAELTPTQLSLATFGTSIQDELSHFGCTLPPPCTPSTYTAPYPYGSAYVLSTSY